MGSEMCIRDRNIAGPKFTKVENVWVKKKDTYGHYCSLQEAKSACHKDKLCSRVYDWDCNGNEYSLIRKGAREYYHAGSCVYIHPRGKSNKRKKTNALSVMNNIIL